MPVETASIEFSSQGNADIQDITGAVGEVVRNSGLTHGTVTIFCPSSTSGLSTIEYESGCLSDIRRYFDENIDPNRDYAHNSRWGDGNGHSHVRAAILGPSLTIPFVDKNLTLGTWQQIIFIDFDNRPRHRKLVAQLIGD